MRHAFVSRASNVALACLVVVLMVGCSNADSTTATRTPEGNTAARKGRAGHGSAGGGGHPAPTNDPVEGSGGASTDAAGSGQDQPSGNPAGGPGASSGGWTESDHDAASWGGEVESYPDLVSIHPVQDGDWLLITFTFAGELPDAMPDMDTIMDVRFGIKRQGRAPAVSFGVRAGPDGWYRDTEYGDYEGNFLIDGDQLLLRVAMTELGDRSVVRWVGTSQWAHRPEVQGTTAYLLDTLPNDTAGRLPISR